MLLFWIEIKMTHLKHVRLFNFIRLAAVLLMQHTWSWNQSYKPWKDLSTGWYSKLSTATNLKAHVVKQDLEFRSQGPTSCSFVSQMHGKNSQFFQLGIEYLAMWAWEQGIKDWDLICRCQEKGELESLSTFEVGRGKVFTSLNGDPSIVQRHLLQLQRGLRHADPNNQKPCGLAPQLMQTHGPGSSNHKKQRVRSTCAVVV